MKKVLSVWSLTILLVTCVGFSSCSDDDKDDGGNGSSSSIVGKWNFVSYTKDIKNPTNPTLESVNNIRFDFERTGEVQLGHYLEIEEDEGVYYIHYVRRDGSSSFVGSCNENEYNIPVNVNSFLPSGTITIKNGTLTFTANWLDEIDQFDSSSGWKTYREEGFTSFLLTWNFKK
jgi:hypothetical protein